MNKEQIAEKIAEETWGNKLYDAAVYDAALRALEHQEARVRELESKNRRLRGLVIEADDYLDTNDLTSIGHGSILHKKFKALRREEVSYFDGVEKGYRLYSLTYGEGVVTDVCPEEGFGIRVSFDSGEYEFFTMDGKFFSKAITQDLYWQKPEITIIDKGKRPTDLPVDAKILCAEKRL